MAETKQAKSGNPLDALPTAKDLMKQIALREAAKASAALKAQTAEEAEKQALTWEKNPYQQALVYAGLGDKDRTFEALNRLAALGPIRIGRSLTYPEMALIRGDPRLQVAQPDLGGG